MRKTFSTMALAMVMAMGCAAVTPAGATGTGPASASVQAPGNTILPLAKPVALARHTECTPDGTCYVYDDNGNVIVVIG